MRIVCNGCVLGVALVSAVLVATGCFSGCGDGPDAVPVIGVGECELYGEAKQSESLATLKAGQKLEILEEQPHWLRVRTAEAKEGWIRRCYACSQAELDRRKAADELPQRVICMAVRENGKTSVYGGPISIRDNRVAFESGQGFWPDESTTGKELEVGGKSFTGDPQSLLLLQSAGAVKLKIWRRTGGD